MSRRRVIALTLVATVTAMALLPMRLALAVASADAAGLEASEVRGTVWSATARDLRLATAPVGTVSMGFAPLALLTARLRLDIERTGDDPRGPLSGRWQRTLTGSTTIDLSGTVDGPANSPLPIDSVRFDGFSATFDGQGCANAAGMVRLGLRARLAGLDLRNGLSGAASCRAGALIIPLVGQSGMERLTLSLRPDGSYLANLQIRADDPLLAAALTAAGLQPVAGGFGMQWQGRY